MALNNPEGKDAIPNGWNLFLDFKGNPKAIGYKCSIDGLWLMKTETYLVLSMSHIPEVILGTLEKRVGEELSEIIKVLEDE